MNCCIDEKENFDVLSNSCKGGRNNLAMTNIGTLLAKDDYLIYPSNCDALQTTLT